MSEIKNKVDWFFDEIDANVEKTVKTLNNEIEIHDRIIKEHSHGLKVLKTGKHTTNIQEQFGHIIEKHKGLLNEATERKEGFTEFYATITALKTNKELYNEAYIIEILAKLLDLNYEEYRGSFKQEEK